MTPAVVIAALAAVVIWSGGPVATKLAVHEFPVLAVAIARTCVGGFLVFPMVLALGIPLPRQMRQVAALILSGLSSYVGFPLLFCYGMTETSGTHGVMILAFLPVLTGLMASLAEGRLPRGLWWLGCAVAIAGEAVLLWGSVSRAQISLLHGDPVVFASTLFLAFGYVSGGRLTRQGYAAQATAYWSVSIATLLLTPFLPFAIAGTDLASASGMGWASIAYLAIGVTVVGYVLWFWAMARGGIARVGLVQFFQPVLGVIASYFLLSEPLTPRLVLASCLIVGGIAIANRSKAG